MNTSLKPNCIIAIFISLVCSSTAFSQIELNSLDEGQNRFWYGIDEEKIAQEEKSLLLDQSQLAAQRDQESGLDLKTYDTHNDNRKIGFAYLANANVRDAAEISTFEINYGIKKDWYWLEFYFARTTATNDSIFGYNTNINIETTELKAESSSINEFGIGLATRTKYLQAIYDSEQIFETLSATLNYVTLSEPYYSDDYKGPGIKADYGVNWRLSSSYHFGFKGSYHLASIKKESTSDTERSYERSLVIDWFSIGLDMTFYY